MLRKHIRGYILFRQLQHPLNGREKIVILVTHCRGGHSGGALMGSDGDSVHPGRPLMAGVFPAIRVSGQVCIPRRLGTEHSMEKPVRKGTKRRLEMKSCCDHIRNEAVEGKETG